MNLLTAEPALAVLVQVEQLYQQLMKCCGDPESPSLGGALLWAGEADDAGCQLMLAAGIAGAATLAATADATHARRSLHDGAADFVVHSLDEALRILKNEVRKQAAVSVCVVMSPRQLQAEMDERGVMADLTREPIWEEVAKEQTGQRMLCRASSARAMAAFDRIASQLVSDSPVAERWLQLAPRYQGRQLQRVRLLRTNVADLILHAVAEHNAHAPEPERLVAELLD